MKKLILFCFTAFLMNDPAHSDDKPTWEVSGSSSISMNFYSSSSDSSSTSSSGTSTYLNTKLGYFLKNPQWELISSFGLSNYSDGGQSLEILPLIGLAYNFSEDLKKSFFVSASLGIDYISISSSGSRTYSPLAGRLAIAKRVELFQNVFWNPEVAYFFRNSAKDGSFSLNAYSSFQLNIFSFSILF